MWRLARSIFSRYGAVGWLMDDLPSKGEACSEAKSEAHVNDEVFSARCNPATAFAADRKGRASAKVLNMRQAEGDNHPVMVDWLSAVEAGRLRSSLTFGPTSVGVINESTDKSPGSSLPIALARPSKSA